MSIVEDLRTSVQREVFAEWCWYYIQLRTLIVERIRNTDCRPGSVSESPAFRAAADTARRKISKTVQALGCPLSMSAWIETAARTATYEEQWVAAERLEQNKLMEREHAKTRSIPGSADCGSQKDRLP